MPLLLLQGTGRHVHLLTVWGSSCNNEPCSIYGDPWYCGDRRQTLHHVIVPAAHDSSANEQYFMH